MRNGENLKEFFAYGGVTFDVSGQLVRGPGSANQRAALDVSEPC